MVETIVFAMIAAFLGLRLYSVLGKRTGHEQGFGAPAETPNAPASARQTNVEEQSETFRPPEDESTPLSDDVVAGLRVVASLDHRFDVSEFLEAAAHAYQMILEAYWNGDIEAVRAFVASDVLEAFSDAIEARSAAGETLDNRLVSIEKAVVSDVEINDKVARLTVAFSADIAAVTRNAAGEVVAGSTTDAIPTHDSWTFERNMRESDPNWLLVDTDEAE